MKVIVHTRRDGLYDFEVVHTNGDSLCNSSQGYVDRDEAARIGSRVVSGHYFPDGNVTIEFDSSGVTELRSTTGETL